jgi:hypothetical protein
MSHLPVKPVPVVELRKKFNERDYQSKIASGDIWEEILDSPHATPKHSGQPFCTHSQMIAYREHHSNKKVALVHQYLRPDGTIGGCGRPDPKWLLCDEEIWAPEKLSR